MGDMPLSIQSTGDQRPFEISTELRDRLRPYGMWARGYIQNVPPAHVRFVLTVFGDRSGPREFERAVSVADLQYGVDPTAIVLNVRRKLEGDAWGWAEGWGRPETVDVDNYYKTVVQGWDKAVDEGDWTAYRQQVRNALREGARYPSPPTQKQIVRGWVGGMREKLKKQLVPDDPFTGLPREGAFGKIEIYDMDPPQPKRRAEPVRQRLMSADDRGDELT